MAVRTYEDSWTKGFEDAIELTYSILAKSKDLNDAKNQLQEYLGLIKDRKFRSINLELGAVDHYQH